jgi:hypothetical protein
MRMLVQCCLVLVIWCQNRKERKETIKWSKKKKKSFKKEWQCRLVGWGW